VTRTRRERRGRTAAALVLAGFMGMGSGRSHAYDAATTHAGLTQQAIVASRLHDVLTKRLGRSLGLFELVQLPLEELPVEQRMSWKSRLGWLDPAGGYRPDNQNRQAALGWVLAGAVLSHVPAERARLHFWDPSTGRGLAQAGGLTALTDATGAVFDDASLRGVATGAAARRDQPAAWTWLNAVENDEGLPAFEASLASAVTSATPAARDSALARSLLALGGILAVLEDLGEPAHVRNDLDRAFLSDAADRGHPGLLNRGSRYERWVADHLGQSGVPAASSPVRRPTLQSYFVAADGEGLGNRTQRRFFSIGTLPEDQPATSISTARGLAEGAQASLTYALPAVKGLSFGPGSEPHYLVEKEGDLRCRKAAYTLGGGWLRFSLDESVYADMASVLLPEIGGYAAGLIDFLFRAELTFSEDNGLLKAELTGSEGALSQANLVLLAEDAKGRRTVIGTFADVNAASVPVPAGAQRVLGVLRGRDQAGPLVAVGARALTKP